MPRVNLPRVQLKGSNNSTPPVSAGDIVFQVDGAQFDLLGGEILVATNEAATSLDFIVRAVANDLRRSVDLVRSVPAFQTVLIGPLRQSGWRQPDGKCFVDVSGNWFRCYVLAPP